MIPERYQNDFQEKMSRIIVRQKSYGYLRCKNMSDIVYWIIGGLWILICFALGLYIRSNGAAEIKLRIGFTAIFISYLFGIGILVAALYI